MERLEIGDMKKRQVKPLAIERLYCSICDPCMTRADEFELAYLGPLHQRVWGQDPNSEPFVRYMLVAQFFCCVCRTHFFGSLTLNQINPDELDGSEDAWTNDSKQSNR